MWREEHPMLARYFTPQTLVSVLDRLAGGERLVDFIEEKVDRRPGGTLPAGSVSEAAQLPTTPAGLVRLAPNLHRSMRRDPPPSAMIR
jgi:hypothetical protein